MDNSTIVGGNTNGLNNNRNVTLKNKRRTEFNEVNLFLIDFDLNIGILVALVVDRLALKETLIDNFVFMYVCFYI